MGQVNAHAVQRGVVGQLPLLTRAGIAGQHAVHRLGKALLHAQQLAARLQALLRMGASAVEQAQAWRSLQRRQLASAVGGCRVVRRLDQQQRMLDQLGQAVDHGPAVQVVGLIALADQHRQIGAEAALEHPQRLEQPLQRRWQQRHGPGQGHVQRGMAVSRAVAVQQPQLLVQPGQHAGQAQGWHARRSQFYGQRQAV